MQPTTGTNSHSKVQSLPVGTAACPCTRAPLRDTLDIQRDDKAPQYRDKRLQQFADGYRVRDFQSCEQ